MGECVSASVLQYVKCNSKKFAFLRKHREVFKSKEIKSILGEVEKSLFKKVSDGDVSIGKRTLCL